MAHRRTILASVIAILVLGSLGWMIWHTFQALGQFLVNLKSDVAVAIVAAASTIVVSVLTLAITKVVERRVSIQQELRAKKVPVYESIIEMLFRALYAEKLGQESVSQVELMEFFVKSTEKMTIWGSDELVEAFGRFRSGLKPSEPIMVMFEVEDLMLAIRKDLGHSNRGLKRGSILRMFINDIDAQLAGLTAAARDEILAKH